MPLGSLRVLLWWEICPGCGFGCAGLWVRAGALRGLPAVSCLQLQPLSGASLCLQHGEASLFEVNIRYVGGLLAAYYLTGEEVGLL